ncbi:hypothetical protein Fot_37912 [Forsythia ovata]|uniref:Uncharacterized protein n=1 Tax=Forsythia ovata TaxID=205694 RepID=A0ABD1S0C7_9LAMI
MPVWLLIAPFTFFFLAEFNLSSIAGFYFSKIPKFKIRSERVVDAKEDILPQPPVPRTASVPAATVSLTSKVATNVSSSVLLTPEATTSVPPMVSLIPKETMVVPPIVLLLAEATVGISSALFLEGPLHPSENVRLSGEGKGVVNDEEEAAMPKMEMEYDDNVGDSWKAKRGWETPLRKVREITSLPQNSIRLG